MTFNGEATQFTLPLSASLRRSSITDSMSSLDEPPKLLSEAGIGGLLTGQQRAHAWLTFASAESLVRDCQMSVTPLQTLPRALRER